MLNIYQESISGALNIIKNIQILFVNIKCIIIYEKLYKRTLSGEKQHSGIAFGPGDNMIIIL